MIFVLSNGEMKNGGKIINLMIGAPSDFEYCRCITTTLITQHNSVITRIDIDLDNLNSCADLQLAQIV